ncbi:toprim domain-containing protein [Dysgonomonas massiliensis]|uniref:toprim domain-containing protein n=1 Tax=Dysgonomonas massiliensis TaxID=2040292 RepID=UPI000C7808F7|nr:toprim domain-containing protein [Dysgonomonas massiliensis]
MDINGFKIKTFNKYNLPEGQKRSVCPLCSHNRKPQNQKAKVLMIDWERGLATCQHCGEVIQIHEYESKKDSKPKVYAKPQWSNRTELSDRLVKWFEGRGISQLSLKLLKITESKEFMPQVKKEVNTVQFNYFRDGELVNIKYRDGAKNFKLFKDAERIMYNLDCCKTSKDVVIVEGEMDVLSFVEAGIMNVMSVPNGSTLGNSNLEYIDNCIEYFENKEKIYLALDNDEAGQNTTKELVRRFGIEKCLLVDFGDCKDANEYLVKYGKEKLAFVLREAKEVPIEGVSSVLDWQDQFEDYLVNGMQQGYKTGIESFDRIFSTYTGQSIAVTGIPSSGKSDFVDMMCLGYNRNYGWKIAIASPENKPNTIHAGKIISKLAGKWVNKKEYLSEGWFKRAVDKINDMYKYIDLSDGYDLDEVLEKTRSLIFKFGIKVLVIDPFNKVRLKASLSKNVNEYTNDYLYKLDEFARKHDILIIIVAHPTKPSQENMKNYEPTFYSIKGGGEWYDMMPHGLCVHRDYDNELVKIKVMKVKFSHLGENNKFTWLKWNKNNGRYIDYSFQSENPESVSNPIIDDSNWLVEAENNVEQSNFDFNKISTEAKEDNFFTTLDKDKLPF